MNVLTEHLQNQEYCVIRDVESIPMKGYFPFSIQHCKGEPARFFVTAVSQEHADEMVDEWLKN